jgi:hypothetical protein
MTKEEMDKWEDEGKAPTTNLSSSMLTSAKVTAFNGFERRPNSSDGRSS